MHVPTPYFTPYITLLSPISFSRATRSAAFPPIKITRAFPFSHIHLQNQFEIKTKKRKMAASRECFASEAEVVQASIHLVRGHRDEQ